MLQRYFIKLSYFGKNYCGWQRQPNGLSVQQVLEESLSLICKQDIQITAAGRTDAGVHASMMYFHFNANIEKPKELIYRLNSLLPKDIAVQQIYDVDEVAHARFDAISRTYHYKLITQKNPFLYHYTYYYPYKDLDFKKMNSIAKTMYSTRDFKAFSKSKTDVKTTICKVSKAQWFRDKDVYIFEITADRFLRNMVRAILGTLLKVGNGCINKEDFINIMKSRDRRNSGASVPACGLYLVDIQYPYLLN